MVTPAALAREHAVSVYDNPLSSRFDENDALMYFDDVKVPWERLFVHRDTDMCRAQFHGTQGHAYQNYQAQIRLSVKITFLAALTRRVTEAIGATNIPEQLGMLAAQDRHGQCDAVRRGGVGPAARRAVRAEQAFYVVPTQDLYPRVVQTIRDLAGGALIILPSSLLDFANPELVAISTRPSAR
jgi:4-hydroxyphenylacetate 3-monooxygenase